MSRSVTDPRFAFKASVYDPTSGLTSSYVLLFFHEDQSVELIDETTKKTFLKRCHCPTLHKNQFFLGSEIVVFGRTFKLTAYADKVTEQLSERVSEATIVVMSGDHVFAQVGRILDVLTQEMAFSIREMHTIVFHSSDWMKKDSPVAQILPNRFAERQALVLYLIRDHAIEKALELPRRLGLPSDIWTASNKQDVASAEVLVQMAHSRPPAIVAPDGFGGQGVESLPSSSVVVVKPHTVALHRGGEVIQFILDEGKKRHDVRLCVKSLSQFTISSMQADQYFQPYKGVLKDYRAIVENASSGALWAVQFAAADGSNVDVVTTVREITGPFDPVIAKVLRPHTLRAKLGTDRVRNVVHCSDLPEDGAVDAAFWWGATSPLEA